MAQKVEKEIRQCKEREFTETVVGSIAEQEVWSKLMQILKTEFNTLLQLLYNVFQNFTIKKSFTKRRMEPLKTISRFL